MSKISSSSSAAAAATAGAAVTAVATAAGAASCRNETLLLFARPSVNEKTKMFKYV